MVELLGLQSWRGGNKLQLSPHRRDTGAERLMLLRLEHRHPRALRPVPSSRDHLQAPRALLTRYLLWVRASPEFPLWR